MSLSKIIATSEKRILKGLIWELGDPSYAGKYSIQAMQVAALARENISKGERESRKKNVNSDQSGMNAHATASKWVSSHFMYLSVNIVQQKWQDKTLGEKIRAFRSLNLMLKFLSATEAPQFLTQMVATVTMAISNESIKNMNHLESSKVWSLRLIAAQNLTAYINLLLKDNIEIIGTNLAALVVPLFPIVEDSSIQYHGNCNASKMKSEAGKAAAALFEDLTSGTFGEKLAEYFKDIPFLPSSRLLDNVRENLHQYGIDFNNFLLCPHRIENPADGLDFSLGEKKSKCDTNVYSKIKKQDENLICALRNRLRVICPLLRHESASVRVVSLQHLTDLLSNNRISFCALVEKEDPSSIGTALTVLYEDRDHYERQGTVTNLIEVLLSLAATEHDHKAKMLLGKCFGEIGAIDPHRLGVVTTATHNKKRGRTSDSLQDRISWQLFRPPWESSVTEYALQLLTKQLVIALKAAPNSSEQHRVAHAIQQILTIVDANPRKGEEDESAHIDTSSNLNTQQKGQMSSELSKKLENEGVLDIVEPYWASNFLEKSKNSTKSSTSPPFFRKSQTYSRWISRWSHYMILRSHENSTSTWRSLFYACRTVVRSSAATSVSEFIIPVLVLERLYFGNANDETEIIQELKDVFELPTCNAPKGVPTVQMPYNDQQKAVTMAFNLLDILKCWSNRETEGIFKRKSKSGTYAARNQLNSKDTCLTGPKSVEKIDDLIHSLSLEKMASTAAAMGMHARALLCLESKARANLVGPIFNTIRSQGDMKNDPPFQVTARLGLGNLLLQDIDVSLLKEVLGKLDDYPTMKAFAKNDGFVMYDINNIKERESRGDWVGALSDYERALRSQTKIEARSEIEKLSLKCLLEFGLYESVLNQANGFIKKSKIQNTEAKIMAAHNFTPIAVGAAWRLGRWDDLHNLIEEYGTFEKSIDPRAMFELEVGKAMLGLRNNSKEVINKAIRSSRDAIMCKLALTAKDGYERSYSSLIKLQCIREIEVAASLLCDDKKKKEIPALSVLALSPRNGGWAWSHRLKLISNFESYPLSDIRLALARLPADQKLARDQLFRMGKRARKDGFIDAASTYFAQCRTLHDLLSPCEETPTSTIEIISDIQMQFAKLEYQSGQISSALRILGMENIRGWSKLDECAVKAESIKRLKIIIGYSLPVSEEYALIDIAKRLLRSTRWIVQGGLQSVSEVMERFTVVNQLRPSWEKSHFEFGKYVDSLLETRILGIAQHEGWSAEEDSVRRYALSEDMNCQNYLYMAMEQYLDALKVSDAHVYQVLPRLLSLWFEYTLVERSGTIKSRRKRSNLSDTPLNLSSDPSGFLRHKKNEVNVLLKISVDNIPTSMFYTAVPQLISRICHKNQETSSTVQILLTKLLRKFPGQMMWALAWVRNSLNHERSKRGHEIFREAQKQLLAFAKEKKIDKEKERIIKKCQKILLSSQSFVNYLIGIAKHIPKDDRLRFFNVKKWRGEVELSDFIPPIQSALTSPIDPIQNQDPFPRFRAAHGSVQVMSSKAKPKRITFFVIPGTQSFISKPSSSSTPQPEDIGELHFLLKNEAKGDLRKDARVQDLNIVINRLMATTTNQNRKKRQRLLLRTFAVTCLSEDCGILEWVPNTESFRTLASKTFNPQAAGYSKKRRGRRLANFGDPSLKKNYEYCQNYYFTKGDLAKAARLFEIHFLNNFPPLFYWWFVSHFLDSHAWYEARNNFTISAAVWSAVGHIIGLGDRHSENLLIDTCNGGCVHVDFDCIFDKGLTLPKPEIIPFRLTPNMVDAFGPVGADGIYTESLKSAISVLRENRDTLISVLEPFLKDPIIDWKKSKLSQRQGGVDSNLRDSMQAQRSIKVIDERLRGIYNLRNPNFSKIQRIDQVDIDQEDDMSRMIPLSIEGQVQKMILEATSHENLIQLYIGWMPWI